MSIDPPTFVQSLQNNIRARPISWEGAVRAKTISDTQLKKIKAIDKVRKEQRRTVIENDTATYAELFLGGENEQSIFEAAARREDITQYMLVLMGDVIDDIDTFAEALAEHPDPFKPLLPLLKQSSTPEAPISILTSSVLANLIAHISTSSKAQKQVNVALPQIFTYLSKLAKTTDAGLQDIAVQEYSSMLRTKEARLKFWDHRKDTLTPLMDILRSASGSSRDNDSTLYSGGGSTRSISDGAIGGGVGLQLLYHVLLVIWQLSFEGATVGEGLHEDHDIVLLYTHLLRISPKEKTTRLLLGTLLNLVSSSSTILLPAAVLARLPATLKLLKTRHLTDPDLLDDLNTLQEKLDEYTATQTTFDEYAAEIDSGHLRWSPPHRNPDFWKDNARKILEEDKGAIVKKLAAIMSKKWENDRQVLAIGCNDVSCLVKEVPERRWQLEKAGLKTRVMELMQSEDESVRWESLRAVGEFLRYQVS